jgi:succinate dehydrogenase/fumarate reductase flavoprotein subunit
VDIDDYKGDWLFMPGKGTQVKDFGAYGIPYRCLVPQKIDGLLVAGRCLSASHEAQASARVMGTCMAMGQAAGTAAALSAKQGISPRDIDRNILVQTLTSQGAITR